MEVAILIPCYNESVSIKKVVEDCFKAVPFAKIYVYDNNSTDNTALIAKESGAIVKSEKYQGKGSVVRRMFADIEADVYVLIDGDATYHAESIPKMIEKLVQENLDMVTGVRKMMDEKAYPAGHQWGNKCMTKLVHLFFGQTTADMLSGLRVFSKRFVKSFPANSKGFEIETELTVFSSSMRLNVGDYDTPYFARPEGSTSKLSTFKDGWKILKMIAVLIKEERPLFFFSLVALGFVLASLLAAFPVVWEYMQIKKITHIPLAILSVGLMLCAGVNFAIALILDSVAKTKKEMRRFHYLSIK